MSKKKLYRVLFEEVAPVLVVATSAKEAIDYAEEFLDGDTAESVELSNEKDTAWLWVGFESASDCEHQVRDLINSGLCQDLISRRVTERLGIGPIYWEVGCRREHWCKHTVGVLTGGSDA